MGHLALARVTRSNFLSQDHFGILQVSWMLYAMLMDWMEPPSRPSTNFILLAISWSFIRLISQMESQLMASLTHQNQRPIGNGPKLENLWAFQWSGMITSQMVVMRIVSCSFKKMAVLMDSMMSNALESPIIFCVKFHTKLIKK